MILGREIANAFANLDHDNKAARTKFLQLAVPRYSVLRSEYKARCTEITRDFQNYSQELFQQKLQILLNMAKLLAYMYGRNLKSYDETNIFTGDVENLELNLRLANQHFLYNFLSRDEQNALQAQEAQRQAEEARRHAERTAEERAAEELEAGVENQNKIEPSWLNDTKILRKHLTFFNWFRLFSVRVKNVSLAITNLIIFHVDLWEEPLKELISWIRCADTFFLYAAWIFFIPRFGVNGFFWVLHTVPCPLWMDEDERELGFWTLVKTQTPRRGTQMANDGAWLILGLLICFEFGPTAPISALLTTLLYGYDVLNAGVRALFKIYRLTQLKNAYEADAQRGNEDSATMLPSLIERINFEKKKVELAVAYTVLLLIGTLLCMPAVVAAPWALPVFALAIVATLGFVQRDKMHFNANTNEFILRSSMLLVLGMVFCLPAMLAAAPYIPVLSIAMMITVGFLQRYKAELCIAKPEGTVDSMCAAYKKTEEQRSPLFRFFPTKPKPVEVESLPAYLETPRSSISI